MKRLLIIMLGAALAVTAVSCKKNTEQSSVFSDADVYDGITMPDIGGEKVVDTKKCSVTVKDTGMDITTGAFIELEMKNKSYSSDMMFTVEDIYLNGVCTDAFSIVEVPASKKVTETVSFSLDMHEKYGITEINIMEFRIVAEEIGTGEGNAVVFDDAVSIYPNGKEKASFFTFDSSMIQKTVVQNEALKASILDIYKDDFYDYCIDFLFENVGSNDITVEFDDTVVNGESVDPFVYEAIAPGRQNICRVHWYASQLEASGVTEPKRIQTTIIIRDYDTYEIIGTETITIDI